MRNKSGRGQKNYTVQVQTKSLNSTGEAVPLCTNGVSRGAIVYHGNVAKSQIILDALQRGNHVVLEVVLDAPTSRKQMASIPNCDCRGVCEFELGNMKVYCIEIGSLSSLEPQAVLSRMSKRDREGRPSLLLAAPVLAPLEGVKPMPGRTRAVRDDISSRCVH